MKTLIALLITTAGVVATNARATTYSTEATMSVQKDEDTYRVDVRVSQLIEQAGKFTERLIEAPRILSAPGVPATLYSGLQPSNPNYANEDNVTVDVSWPYPNESGLAHCAVVVKHGETIVSKSNFRLKVEGPGRTPLVLKAQEVDPKSVRVVEEKSQVFVMLEFTGKTKDEVKKLANENYGNKLQVQDSTGRLTEGGLSFGTYKETGMAVQYSSKTEAEQVAALLRGANPK